MLIAHAMMVFSAGPRLCHLVYTSSGVLAQKIRRDGSFFFGEMFGGGGFVGAVLISGFTEFSIALLIIP